MHTKKLGTATWQAPEDFALDNTFEPGKFWIGRSPVTGDPLGYVDDRHILLVSGSRAGKGTTVIVPNLCLWPGSIFAIDPKGENASVVAARRGDGSEYCEGMGQPVHVLDPFTVAQVSDDARSKFNPLDELDLEAPSFLDDVGRIADAIVVSNPEAKEPFWDQSARNLLKWIIVHVLTHEDHAEAKTLVTVRGLIARGHRTLYKLGQEAGIEDLPSPHRLLWQRISENEAFGGGAAALGEQMLEMDASNAKLVGDILQTLHRHTEFIDSPGMAESLSGSDFSLSELKSSPTGISVFLCLPQRYMAEHFRWLRMLVTLAVGAIEATPGKPESGHRVLFCLDEFAGLKRMQIIEHAVAQIAGAGATLFFVLQSLEQLKSTYKDGWETFLSNCALKVFFGVDDHFSRDYVSKMIGDTEIIRELETFQESEGTSRTETHNTGRTHTRGASESESLSNSRSNAESTSYSETRSRSESRTKGTNQSVSDGTNSSTSRGGNESRSRSSGWNEGSSGSSSWNTSEGSSDGQSSGDSWGRTEWGFRRVSGDNVGRSSGTNRGSSEGGSDGWSTGRNGSKSSSDGKNWSKTKGRSHSESHGSSLSNTDGVTEGKTEGRTRSHTEGVTEGQTRGESSSEARTEGESTAEGSTKGLSHGRNQNLQKRRLLAPEEVGRLFDRPSDGEPGWALVVVGGGRPVVTYRSPYFFDEELRFLFDPHPDHGGGEKLLAELPMPVQWLTGPLAKNAEIEWRVEADERVERGDPLLDVLVPGPAALLREEFLGEKSRELGDGLLDACGEEVDLDLGRLDPLAQSSLRFTIPSPIDGRLAKRQCREETFCDPGERAIPMTVNQKLLLLSPPSERTGEGLVGYAAWHDRTLDAQHAFFREKQTRERLEARRRYEGQQEEIRLEQERRANETEERRHQKLRAAEAREQEEIDARRSVLAEHFYAEAEVAAHRKFEMAEGGGSNTEVLALFLGIFIFAGVLVAFGASAPGLLFGGLGGVLIPWALHRELTQWHRRRVAALWRNKTDFRRNELVEEQLSALIEARWTESDADTAERNLKAWKKEHATAKRAASRTAAKLVRTRYVKALRFTRKETIAYGGIAFAALTFVGWRAMQNEALFAALPILATLAALTALALQPLTECCRHVMWRLKPAAFRQKLIEAETNRLMNENTKLMARKPKRPD